METARQLAGRGILDENRGVLRDGRPIAWKALRAAADLGMLQSFGEGCGFAVPLPCLVPRSRYVAGLPGLES